MVLSDLSVKRPVLGTVLNLLIVAFGAIAFFGLPLRELPDVDQPVVSVDTSYRGAAAQVVETQITRVIEDQLSGIEGVESISANSRDGRSSVNIEFSLGRNLEEAANDVRSAVARARGALPDDADEPVVQKTEADADPILWYVVTSDRLDRTALTDYVERTMQDRLGEIDGVASVRVFGQRPALRVWLQPEALAARGLTVTDVTRALSTQNIELPAGQVEGQQRDYALRVDRAFHSP
ncbi:MAG: efflux RND transporter permease subunit, partial [Hyphomonadaceae bacterium]|nr:efflux RND transporter permease subunit [Hyphomonadaceae bacterium]